MQHLLVSYIIQSTVIFAVLFATIRYGYIALAVTNGNDSAIKDKATTLAFIFSASFSLALTTQMIIG